MKRGAGPVSMKAINASGSTTFGVPRSLLLQYASSHTISFQSADTPHLVGSSITGGQLDTGTLRVIRADA